MKECLAYFFLIQTNLGKDIRTVASGVAGVGDPAEVYAVEIVYCANAVYTERLIHEEE